MGTRRAGSRICAAAPDRERKSSGRGRRKARGRRGHRAARRTGARGSSAHGSSGQPSSAKAGALFATWGSGYRDTFLRDPGAGHRDILTNGGLGQGIGTPQRQVRSRRGGAGRAWEGAGWARGGFTFNS